MRKTPLKVENVILEGITSGANYSMLSESTGVAVSTIKKIKKRNRQQIEELQRELAKKHLSEVEKINRRTYRLINLLLDKDEIGEIKLSVRELVAISSAMYKQTRINSPPYGSLNSTQKILNRYL